MTLLIEEEEGTEDSDNEPESDISICFCLFGRFYRVSYEELSGAWGFDPDSPLLETTNDDDDDLFDGFHDQDVWLRLTTHTPFRFRKENIEDNPPRHAIHPKTLDVRHLWENRVREHYGEGYETSLLVP